MMALLPDSFDTECASAAGTASVLSPAAVVAGGCAGGSDALPPDTVVSSSCSR